MGRLKAWHNLNPLFSGKYKKLLEEYGSKDYSKLLLQESLQDFISYNCGNCGHIQRLQAEELNSIVGHAFRLAYAAHLQKAGSAVKDVIPPFSSSSTSSPSNHTHFTYTQSQSQSSTPSRGVSPSHCQNTHHHHSSSPVVSPSHSSHHSCPRSVPLTPSKQLSHEHSSSYCCTSSSRLRQSHCDANTHTHNDQFPCGSPCSPADREGLNESCCTSNSCNSKPGIKCSSSALAVSSHVSKVHCPDVSAMRTPNPGSHLSHQTGGNPCGTIKPPSSLPGLHCPDQENNNFHSPDSDTSNSPTELNTSRRLGDKPPLIKNVNLSLESNLRLEEELNTVLSCPISSSDNLQMNLTVSQTTNNSGETPPIVGYVNEKNSTDCFSNTESCPSDEKCHLQDELSMKRISEISMNSSGNFGNVTIDVSSSTNVLNTPPPLPERSDSLTPPEEPHLKTAAWFQAGIPREIALEVLSREPVGAFMVRESTSKPGCYALSLRVPRDFTVSGIAHYLIVKTNKGYKIKGFTKEFVTLTALITHHSVMPELLPCPLSLSRYNPTFTTDDNNRNDEDEQNSDEDPDYNTLSDFRKMMSDLNV